MGHAQQKQEPREINREPWWEFPPKPGQSDEDLVWGYLVTYDDGNVHFISETPTAEEMANREGCRIRT